MRARVEQAEVCHCARGWICEAHPDRLVRHDGCTEAGRRSDQPRCPYWQGPNPLALDPRVQFDETISDRHAERQGGPHAIVRVVSEGERMPDHSRTGKGRSKSAAPFDLATAAPKLLDAMVASGLSFEITHVAPTGFEARLGNKTDGYRAEAQGLATSIEAFMWLHRAVLEHFPDSAYAKAFLRPQSGVS